MSLWDEYEISENNIPAYDNRILFEPNSKLNLEKYILWIVSINLTDLSCDAIIPTNILLLSHRDFLSNSYNTLGIVPLVIFTFIEGKTSK